MPLAFAGALSAASSASSAQAIACSDPAPALSRFDYLVLASVADSQRPLSLATYRPQQRTSPEATRVDPMDAELSR